jgi:hypothetical protein
MPVNLRELSNSRTISSLGVQWDAGALNNAIGVSYTVVYSYQDNLGITR